jgi:hypothetical protein
MAKAGWGGVAPFEVRVTEVQVERQLVCRKFINQFQATIKIHFTPRSSFVRQATFPAIAIFSRTFGTIVTMAISVLSPPVSPHPPPAEVIGDNLFRPTITAESSALLLDMDGTIIDSTNAIVKYWERQVSYREKQRKYQLCYDPIDFIGQNWQRVRYRPEID